MKVTVIGCGKMGGGIAERLATEHNLHLFDRNIERTKAFSERIGGKYYQTASEAISKGEVILLAVKPQDLEALAKIIHREFFSEQLIVSCMAGVTQNKLETFFSEIPCLRIMPNLSVKHGVGIVGLVDHDELENTFKEKATKLFSCLGSLHWIPESQINAISSLIGSGPAFISVIIETIIEAGVAMGINSNQSKELTFQLIAGTITTLQESKKHPAEFKLEVASPGGTTISGLKTMEDFSIRSGIINTFLSCYERNIEFSKEEEI